MAVRESVDPLCPAVERVLDLLGRPWTGRVLAALQTGPLRFSELSDKLNQIGDKILSSRLKELETKGLLSRSVDPGPPVRVTYALTPLGAGFGSVVEAIEVWGRALGAARPPPRSRPARSRGAGRRR